MTFTFFLPGSCLPSVLIYEDMAPSFEAELRHQDMTLYQVMNPFLLKIRYHKRPFDFGSPGTQRILKGFVEIENENLIYEDMSPPFESERVYQDITLNQPMIPATPKMRYNKRSFNIDSSGTQGMLERLNEKENKNMEMMKREEVLNKGHMSRIGK